MAKTDNLTDYLTDLAEGIRAKKGTTEPINPQDFRKEIESISGGGSGEGGEWRYYRLEMKESTEVFVQFYGANMKADMGDGEVAVVGVGLIFAYQVPSANWKAVAINVDVPTYSPTNSGIITFREQIEGQGGSIDDLADVGLISITKEQFYSLE